MCSLWGAIANTEVCPSALLVENDTYWATISLPIHQLLRKQLCTYPLHCTHTCFSFVSNIFALHMHLAESVLTLFHLCHHICKSSSGHRMIWPRASLTVLCLSGSFQPDGMGHVSEPPHEVKAVTWIEHHPFGITFRANFDPAKPIKMHFPMSSCLPCTSVAMHKTSPHSIWFIQIPKKTWSSVKRVTILHLYHLPNAQFHQFSYVMTDD